jgi:protein-disulfide isomerase
VKRLMISLTMLSLFAWMNGCTVDKSIQEIEKRLAKMEERLAAIEKLIMPPKEEPQKEAYNIPVGSSHVLTAPGANAEPKAHITVFSNFQCPYCAHADASLRELLKDPTLKDRIDIVFKNFPFERHPMARAAAKASLAAGEQGNDKYWKMVEVLFKNQKDLSDAKFAVWAKQIGLNVDKFKKDLKDNDKKYDELINEDIKTGAETAHLRGTPWILVDGWLLEGEINPTTIKNMLNRHKAEKKN